MASNTLDKNVGGKNSSTTNKDNTNNEDSIQTTTSRKTYNEKSTTSQENSNKTGNVIKIAPKPISGTITKNPSTGQFVLIQAKNGQSVRLGNNSIATTTANNNSTSTITSQNKQATAIQVIRTADGNLVPIKTNKSIQLSNLDISGKKIITTNSTGNPRTFILKNSTSISNQKPMLQTIDVQKGKIQRIIPASISSSSAGTTHKLIINSDKNNDATSSKKIINPQNIIKLSQTTSASGLKTLQFPNKTGGFKYVRVLSSDAAKEAMNNKVTLLRQADNTVKMLNNNKSQSQQSKISLSNNLSTSSGNKLTTVPTFRKINNDLQMQISKRDSEDVSRNKLKSTQQINNGNSNHSQVVKPRILNNIAGAGGLTAQAANELQKRLNTSSKGQFVVVSQELFRSMKFSPKKSSMIHAANSIIHNTAIKLENSPKKLYSSLKPSSTELNSKRSPSPDTGIRRKHCNCTKSQCLKLYCDCFANGEFCQDCNCKECFNNLEYEDERQKAIKMCIERNPAAFKPKITKARDQNDIRLHNKGCNCKRSGCLKNYCECYEAKIACSSNCKCLGCRNVEDRTTIDIIDVAKIAHNFGRGIATKRPYEYLDQVKSYTTSSATGLNQINQQIHHLDDNIQQQPPIKQPYNFITQDVVDATIQCMTAQADECQKSFISPKQTERMILEELGRCLVEIIDFSIRNIEN